MHELVYLETSQETLDFEHFEHKIFHKLKHFKGTGEVLRFKPVILASRDR